MAVRDCLSGAGFRNAAGAFEGAFNEHAFLVAPESLIFSHFPEDASWQKLAEPLSREAFEGLFEAKPALEQLGIRPLSFPANGISRRTLLSFECTSPPKSASAPDSTWELMRS